MLTAIKRSAVGIIPAATLVASHAAFAGTEGSVRTGLDATGASAGSGDLTSIFHKVTNILFIIIGALAVIMLIIGGIMYVTSAGDSKRVESAKNTILYAIIGIVIAVFAGAIVNFVLTQTGH